MNSDHFLQQTMDEYQNKQTDITNIDTDDIQLEVKPPQTHPIKTNNPLPCIDQKNFASWFYYIMHLITKPFFVLILTMFLTNKNVQNLINEHGYIILNNNNNLTFKGTFILGLIGSLIFLIINILSHLKK